ncbi:MAG: gluconate 2-dehydrogenase subunit 3 family protein [Balneolaceae bacterium]|nr:MAG: gluconate 2-dehydrogenase subunit 3 family protein [Balneolaceae bacterium]
MEKIDRREAIKRTTMIMGCALSGTLISAVMSGCSADQSTDWSPQALNRNQLAVAADLAEVILPATSTPGAKDAQVERFIDSLALGFLSPEEKEFLLSGIDHLQSQAFTTLSFNEQNDFITELIADGEHTGFFRLFKQYTLLGFFTSEIGATQVLNYDPIPGIYSGCENLEDVGGRTWAT